MTEIMTFATKATPISVIALMAVIIYQLIRGKSMLSLIRGTQEEKYPKIEDYLEGMNTLVAQNDKLLNNHFKHEIPEMLQSIRRIENTVGEIQKEQVLQGNRITRVEVRQEK